MKTGQLRADDCGNHGKLSARGSITRVKSKQIDPLSMEIPAAAGQSNGTRLNRFQRVSCRGPAAAGPSSFKPRGPSCL